MDQAVACDGPSGFRNIMKNPFLLYLIYVMVYNDIMIAFATWKTVFTFLFTMLSMSRSVLEASNFEAAVLASVCNGCRESAHQRAHGQIAHKSCTCRADSSGFPVDRGLGLSHIEAVIGWGHAPDSVRIFLCGVTTASLSQNSKNLLPVVFLTKKNLILCAVLVVQCFEFNWQVRHQVAPLPRWPTQM